MDGGYDLCDVASLLVSVWSSASVDVDVTVDTSVPGHGGSHAACLLVDDGGL